MRFWILGAILLGWASLAHQQVVDRIVARIEDDIITLSELRELARFQQLVGDGASDHEQLLRQAVEQWIVQAEANLAQYPRPSGDRIEREMERVRSQFASPEAYQARLRELGLTEAAVRRLVERQLYLAGYLDYRFRPAAAVEPAAIEAYYQGELVPQLAARGQAAPPLEQVEEQIREVLIQRQISERAARWLDEVRPRLKIEVLWRGPGA